MRKPAEVLPLLQQLQTSSGVDLVTKEEAVLAAYEQAQSSKGSIFVKVLTIAGGIFSMALLIAFLALADAFNTSGSMILIGSILTGLGLVAGLKMKHLMLDTISVTLFIAGLIILTVGLGWEQPSVTGVCLILLIIGCISLVLAGNYVLAFVAVLVVLGALYVLPMSGYLHLLLQGIIAWGYTLFLLHESNLVKLHPKMTILYHPIRLGLICTLLGIYFYEWVYLQFGTYQYVYAYFPYGSLLVIAAILYASVPVVRRTGITSKHLPWIIIVCWGLLLSPVVFAPDILCALLILLVSFSVRDNSGLVLGIAGLVFYVGKYYYDLQVSLLTKSILLVIPGIIFGALYFVLTKYFENDEKI